MTDRPNRHVALDASSYGDDILTRVTIARLLEQLTPDEREILQLWAEGMGVREIGMVIGTRERGRALTPSGVRHRINRALGRLRQLTDQSP
jgi:DNA-binding NarL/FixJ family response regulator